MFLKDFNIAEVRGSIKSLLSESNSIELAIEADLASESPNTVPVPSFVAAKLPEALLPPKDIPIPANKAIIAAADAKPTGGGALAAAATPPLA